MESYIVFISYFLICALAVGVSDRCENDKRAKRYLVIGLGILLFLLGALRNENTGTDTRFYVMKFERPSSMAVLWEKAKASFDSEQGYFLLGRWFYDHISTSGQMWLAFLVLLFVVPCCVLTYKYSECPPISFIYVVALFIFTFCWQGLRQAIAISICLFAFIFLYRKKIIPFLLLVLLAYQFHQSALIFLLAFPISLLKPSFWDFVIIIGVWLLSYLSPASVLNFLAETFAESEKVSTYTGGDAAQYSYTLFFVLLLIFICCYYFKDELIASNPCNKVLLQMSAAGVAMQALAGVIAEFFRVSYYFNIFNMLLVANLCQLLFKKFPKKLYRLYIVLFLVAVFFAAGGFDYWFFWQTR